MAWAHTQLVSSTPPAGSTITVSPKELRLWFNEAPELVMTVVTLADSGGRLVTLGPIERVIDSTLTLRVKVMSPLADGRYVVKWKTFGADGHAAQGEYSFLVFLNAPAHRVATQPASVTTVDSTVPAAVREKSAQRAPKPRRDSLPFIVVRTILFTTMLAMIGAVVFRTAVLPRTPGSDKEGRARLLVQIAGSSALASFAFLAAALVRLFLQNHMVEYGLEIDVPIREIIFHSRWGVGWLTITGSVSVAALGFILASRRKDAGWVFAAIGCLGLSAGMSIGGHPEATDHFKALSMVSNSVHAFAAGGWLGTLLWFTWSAMPYLQSTGDGRAQRLKYMTNAFSPVALTCVAIVALTGLVNAWLRLGTLNELWESLYGQVLMAKLAFAGVVANFGYVNWRRVRPRLGAKSGATALLTSTARSELAFSIFVIITTAVLVALPAPGAP